MWEPRANRAGTASRSCAGAARGHAGVRRQAPGNRAGTAQEQRQNRAGTAPEPRGNRAGTARGPRRNRAGTRRKTRGDRAGLAQEPRGRAREPGGKLARIAQEPRGNRAGTPCESRGQSAGTTREPNGKRRGNRAGNTPGPCMCICPSDSQTREAPPTRSLLEIGWNRTCACAAMHRQCVLVRWTIRSKLKRCATLVGSTAEPRNRWPLVTPSVLSWPHVFSPYHIGLSKLVARDREMSFFDCHLEERRPSQAVARTCRPVAATMMGPRSAGTSHCPSSLHCRVAWSETSELVWRRVELERRARGAAFRIGRGAPQIHVIKLQPLRCR